MSTSQNGWPLIYAQDSNHLHLWQVPAKSGAFSLLLRRGTPGFLLCHYALWHADEIETIAGKGDDFGWRAPRPIGDSPDISNHGSGTAEDLNASVYPQGAHTFSDDEAARIRQRLLMYDDAIRWGGDYHSLVDEMHFEINVDRSTALTVAHGLKTSSRGRKLLEANPGQGWMI